MAETGTRRAPAITGGALRGLSREDALERYRALPLPTTSDEHWRFTDLAGFDPDAFSANGTAATAAAAESMLDIDVAGIAHVGPAGPSGGTAGGAGGDGPVPENAMRLLRQILELENGGAA